MKVTQGHGEAIIHVPQNKEGAKTILSHWEGSQSLGDHGIIQGEADRAKRPAPREDTVPEITYL